MIKIIADSGSTKTHWAVISEDGHVSRAATIGLNPFQVSGADIASTVRQHVAPLLKDAQERHSPSGTATAAVNVSFFGAGCTKEQSPLVAEAIKDALGPKASADGETKRLSVEVASDMVGAALAACGHRPGIVCILGTGSNSCAWDGERITANVPPLGFILGDEGGGAYMGKRLVGDILKGQMPPEVTDKFQARYRLTAAEAVEHVYRGERPNAWLAAFAPFLGENIAHSAVRQLVEDSLTAFIRRNVLGYDGCRELPLGFVGSIAAAFREPLEAVARREGLTVGTVIKAPMDGLLRNL